eukprot:365144-Chlamydomonas_euryale.AAC.1
MDVQTNVERPPELRRDARYSAPCARVASYTTLPARGVDSGGFPVEGVDSGRLPFGGGDSRRHPVGGADSRGRLVEGVDSVRLPLGGGDSQDRSWLLACQLPLVDTCHLLVRFCPSDLAGSVPLIRPTSFGRH